MGAPAWTRKPLLRILFPRAWVAELAYASVSKGCPAVVRLSPHHASNFSIPRRLKHLRQFVVSRHVSVGERPLATFGPEYYATCYADRRA
jgi:hypothetical protein